VNRSRVLLVLAVLPLALAACGGSSSSKSNPNSANYDPAHTTIKDAGLEACSESQSQIPQNLSSGPGVQNTRGFFLAKDCKGQKTSPDFGVVIQYDSRQSVDAGYAAIQGTIPNSSSAKFGPLVIVTIGPHHEEYLAMISQALKAQGAGGTTTS